MKAVELQYFLKMKSPFFAPEGCFGRICWLHGSHSFDKRGNWFLYYSMPLGHNRSPVDKDGLDLTFVNIQLLCFLTEGHETKSKTDRNRLSTSFVVWRENKVASSSITDFSKECIVGYRMMWPVLGHRNPNLLINRNTRTSVEPVVMSTWTKNICHVMDIDLFLSN